MAPHDLHGHSDLWKEIKALKKRIRELEARLAAVESGDKGPVN